MLSYKGIILTETRIESHNRRLSQKVIKGNIGLCVASRAWYFRVDQEFQKLGAKVSKYEKSLYI